MIKTEIFHKPGIENRSDFIKAKEIANHLSDFINQTAIQDKIQVTHKLNARSGDIQDIFIDKAMELGFASEKKELFESYQLRPDYYLPITKGTGIIMEVERGKTLANNMDLLDVWKCHICKEANILFLIVPQIRHNSTGQSKIYNTVLRRIGSFFETENQINVDAVFVFGY